MLEPNSRQLLREALRPPAGYALDRAVTTTFGLDLMALLTIPVSFTLFHLRDHDGPPAIDPLALLEALRRYAGRLTVFCQAGQIHLPRQVQLLLGYVEESVHQVRAPRDGGVFHPKLTVLRFTADPAAGDADATPVLYRVLCSSRNLTFDRSWDTLLTLDGPLAAHRTKAFGRNRPLSRFVAALPDLAVYPMPPERVDDVRAMADELLRVDFELPDGFNDLAFCPLGIDGVADPALAKWPVLQHRRTLAMAPFVSNGFMQQFHDAGQPLELISRPESLDALSPDALGGLQRAWYMNAAADPIPESTEGVTTGDTQPPADDEVRIEPAEQLHGLHAKLFVADDGWDAHVYTGSANATTAAFERNVEFLVRLTGRKSRCGVDALMHRQDDGEDKEKDKALTFANLLVAYQRTGEAVVDATRHALERLLDDARYILAGARLTGDVEALPSDGEAASRFRVSLLRPADRPLGLPDGVVVTCHLLTMKPGNAVPITDTATPTLAVFDGVSFEALTPFVAVHLIATNDGQTLSSAFVLNVPMADLPTDRQGRLLLTLLSNRKQLLRYLLMLLADDEQDARRLAEAFGPGDGGAGQTRPGFGLPLLEPLLRALDRGPARLDHIATLIEEFQKTPQGRELVGEEFLSVWQPIWAAREAMRRE